MLLFLSRASRAVLETCKILVRKPQRVAGVIPMPKARTFHRGNGKAYSSAMTACEKASTWQTADGLLRAARSG